MGSHDKRFGGVIFGIPHASGSDMRGILVVSGSIGMRYPGMKEGCSGENVLERER